MSKPLFPVVETFASLQGEGYNTGKHVVFVRLGGCNLACSWCDTDHNRFEWMDAERIARKVLAFGPRAMILTGGEPFLQEHLGSLLARFKELGFWIGVETNGLQRPPASWREAIDYLAVSPKAHAAERYDDATMVRQADEVRIVVDGEVLSFCRSIRRRIAATHYFVSPCERDGRFNLEEALRLLGTLNEGVRRGNWLLSLQTHKLAGLP